MLETDRLILRPFNDDDTDAVFGLRSDSEMMRFIREPQPRDEAANWMKLVSSRWATERIGLCAVIEKASGDVIGWCGLWRLPETDEVEIGYAIAAKFWRKGLASEAAEKILAYGFGDLTLEKIVAVARPENTASRRVMEKLGMRYDCTGIFYGSELVHYSITKSAWEAKENNAD